MARHYTKRERIAINPISPVTSALHRYTYTYFAYSPIRCSCNIILPHFFIPAAIKSQHIHAVRGKVDNKFENHLPPEKRNSKIVFNTCSNSLAHYQHTSIQLHAGKSIDCTIVMLYHPTWHNTLMQPRNTFRERVNVPSNPFGTTNCRQNMQPIWILARSPGHYVSPTIAICPHHRLQNATLEN